MKKSFRTSGTCASMIDVEIEDGVVTDVSFSGGCEGNLTGVSRLVVGMQVDDAIARLRGITCGRKSTSCPDQLAKALEAMV
ncbi:MAG: TIGR03905 family TSCPD domain-containing protein [Oscillospiraceae bacterium]|nr:TIGR03905 family TSCPD domain-containing protein [Oscillospiraceae bacterium]